MPVVIFFALMEEKIDLERDGNAAVNDSWWVEEDVRNSVLLCSLDCSEQVCSPLPGWERNRDAGDE